MDSYTTAQWNHTQSIVASLAEEAQEMVLRPGHWMLAEALIRSHMKIIPHHTSTLINSSFWMGTLSIVPSLYHDPFLMGLFKANQEYLFSLPCSLKPLESWVVLAFICVQLCTMRALQLKGRWKEKIYHYTSLSTWDSWLKIKLLSRYVLSTFIT